VIGNGNRLRFLLIAKQCRSSEWARWPWNDLVWLISAGGAAKRLGDKPRTPTWASVLGES
jgi:hypothetical protein